MTDISEYKNIDDSHISLWLFKKSYKNGGPIFSGRWIEIAAPLENKLKELVGKNLDYIEEIVDYSILTQAGDGISLKIPLDETHASVIIDKASDFEASKKVKKSKDIYNTFFYAVKVNTNGRVFFAVKKVDKTWKTKHAKDVVTAIFSDAKLDINNGESFEIRKDFDFLILPDEVIIINKRNFESVLDYKANYIESFSEIKGEPEFINIFSDITHIETYVGENKIQLRRICAIKEKGHYKDAAFMASLKANCTKFKFNIQFDSSGKIIPTPDNCKDIFQALLDHRLISHYQDNLYDVPDAVRIP